MGKVERIYELENKLDLEDLDEADRVAIHDALERLRSDSLDEEGEERAWQVVVSKGGDAMRSGPVKRVMEGLVAALLRAKLGI